MGIDVPAFRFLLEERTKRGPFGRTLQIGHQGIHLRPQPSEYTDRLVRESGLGASAKDMVGDDGYADHLFRKLGATTVDAMDNSLYEGANLVCDLNKPVPRSLHERFDTIYDGGSLEHIFNTAAVIKNFINMLSLNGRLMIATTANNYLGHGFYQFSPEWAFRTLSAAWGCKVNDCYMVNCDETYDAIPALDPEIERKRIEIFTTPVPTYLMISAQKIGIPRFDVTPQQSDYSLAWKEAEKTAEVRSAATRNILRRLSKWWS